MRKFIVYSNRDKTPIEAELVRESAKFITLKYRSIQTKFNKAKKQ